MSKIVPFEQIMAASLRIRGYINSTPCTQSERLNRMIGGGTQVFLKKENLQHTGAYKERGAVNKLLTLTAEEQKRGVISASAGNHAQAVAYHAGNLGIKSTIFMPHGTPSIKVSRTQYYGATVKISGTNFDDTYTDCLAEAERSGALLLHPFDDPAVIAGQGTIGIEILDAVPKADVILVPVGGGGLISGISIAAKEINPKIRIVGVEPAKIPTMAIATKSDKPEIEAHEAVTTIADGMNVRRVGKLTRKICKEYVDEFVSVTDEEICRAILFLLEGEKVVSEGAGASGVAALMAGKVKNLEGKKVISVVSGGNIDVNVIAQIIELGLMDTGRRVRLRMNMPDRPGALKNLLSIISDMEANVYHVAHERSSVSFNFARVELTLDVRDVNHSNEIMARLKPIHPDVTVVR